MSMAENTYKTPLSNRLANKRWKAKHPDYGTYYVDGTRMRPLKPKPPPLTPDEKRAKRRERYHNDAEYRKRIRRQSVDSILRRRDSYKQRLITLLGGKCVGCDIDNPILLVIHHNSTNNEKKAIHDPAKWKGRLQEYQDGTNTNITLLCFNCHILHHHRLRQTTPTV